MDCIIYNRNYIYIFLLLCYIVTKIEIVYMYIRVYYIRLHTKQYPKVCFNASEGRQSASHLDERDATLGLQYQDALTDISQKK